MNRPGTLLMALSPSFHPHTRGVYIIMQPETRDTLLGRPDLPYRGGGVKDLFISGRIQRRRWQKLIAICPQSPPGVG